MLRAGIPGLPGRKKGEYLSDREADEAVKFIRDHKDKPFFLQLANYAVHTPIQAKKDVTEKYQAKIKASSKLLRQKNAKYAAMVESVDDAYGRIQKTLADFGIEDNTLIIFTSDNGGLQGPTNNAPLRSGKGYAYEGGIRVPFLVKWPGVSRPKTTNDTPITSVDIMPTVLSAVGAKLPEDREIDGLDLKPLIEGTGKLGRESIFWHFPHYRHAPGPYSIIRNGDWKLIKWYEGPKALFNLAKDLGEKKNLAETMPHKVKELERELMNHLHSIGAKIPVTKPNP